MNVARLSPKYQTATILVISLIFYGWLYLVGRQFMPFLMFSTMVLVFFFTTFCFKSWLLGTARWKALVFGASIGYVSSVVAVAVVILVIYGKSEFLERFYSSLHVYPIASLAWIYGLFTIGILRACNPQTTR